MNKEKQFDIIIDNINKELHAVEIGKSLNMLSEDYCNGISGTIDNILKGTEINKDDILTRNNNLNTIMEQINEQK